MEREGDLQGHAGGSTLRAQVPSYRAHTPHHDYDSNTEPIDMLYLGTFDP